MPWSISAGALASMNPVVRSVKKRRPQFHSVTTMNGVFETSPVEIMPMLAQGEKPRARGLLGQARTAKTLAGRDPRHARNAQRFSGASDWLGEGLTLADDQTMQGHWSAQTITALTADHQITSGLVRCNPSTAGMTVYLPDLTEWTTEVVVKNGTSYTSAIRVEGYVHSQTIEGRFHETFSESFGVRRFIPDGNHWTIASPTALTPLAHTHPWSDITGEPTTLAGYGITDGATDVELAAHEADTTSVHGIADTSVLLTTATKLDDLAAPDDNTDLNVSTTKHGLAPKAPNSTSQWLRGDAAFAAVPGRLLAFTVYVTGSGNHTWNAATTAAIVQITGGGGGGGGVSGAAAQSAAAGGGGAGGTCIKYLTGLTGGATMAYIVGGGGAGGAAGANNGTDGTSSSMSATYTGVGGTGGTAMATGTALGIASGGAGGGATNGTANITAGSGLSGFRVSGGGGMSGMGGSSYYGGGAAAVANAAGTAGVSYGAGGTGAATIGNTNRAGGNGAGGCIIIWEFA